MTTRRSFLTLSAALGVAAAFALPVQAADFYKGKRLSILINYSAGGPTDIEARLFGRHIAKHIPGNPQIIAKNMAGAGGVVATNYLGQNARPDGETVGYFTATGGVQAFMPLQDAGLRVDPNDFGLIATQAGTSIAYVRRDVSPGINKPEDIMKAEGLKIAGLRHLSTLDIRQRLVLDMLGVKYDYVTGYRGSSDARVAVLQGEAHLHTESQPSYRAQVVSTLVEPGIAIGLYYYPLDDGEQIIPAYEMAEGLDILPFHEFYKKVKGKEPSGQLWDVFREVNRAGSMVQRAIMLPPGSPKDALEALRGAVAKLNDDPEFAEDAMKTINFVPTYDVGARAEQLMQASTQLSSETVTFLKEYVAKVTN